jgi:hypothetical protein
MCVATLAVAFVAGAKQHVWGGASTGAGEFQAVYDAGLSIGSVPAIEKNYGKSN